MNYKQVGKQNPTVFPGQKRL